MKNFIFMCLLLISVGCTQKAPECSDQKNIDQIKRTLYEETLSYYSTGLRKRQNINILPKFTMENLNKAVVIEDMVPSSYEKEINRFTCEANLYLKIGGSKIYSIPIEYVSQLAEKKHISKLNKGFSGQVLEKTLMLTWSADEEVKKELSKKEK